MVIRKHGGKYCVHSRKSGRNLGCSRTKAGARKREREIQYFKHKNGRRPVHVRRHTRHVSRRQRPIRYECPIQRSEASGGDLHAGFYIYRMKSMGSERGEGVIPIPSNVRSRLMTAQTPHQMEAIIAEEEPRLAALDNREFLDCDEAANLMSAALRAHGIPHVMVVGESDEGSSHAYTIVDGRRYDPTHQGYGDGHIESATRWP